MLKRSLFAILSLSVACHLAPLLAQTAKTGPAEKKPAPEKAEPAGKEKKERPLPYQGVLTAIDKSKRTFTVGQRVFQVTANTKFFKGEKTPATMAEGVVGEPVRLSYFKTADGQFSANNVYFGAKPSGKPAETKKAEGAPGKARKQNEQ